MGDPAADEVADGEWIVGGNAQVGVLVVRVRDGHPPAHVAQGAAGRDVQRHRQVDVVGGVALAEQEEREVGLRAGEDGAPGLERRHEARAAGGAAAERREVVVERRVVRDVAAAAQDEPHGKPRDRRGEPLRDAVEERAAARGDDHLRPAGECALLGERRDELAQPVEEAVDLGEHIVAVEDPLVALDAGQLEPRRRGDRPGDGERFLLVAGAGAAPGEAELDEHADRPAGSGRRRERLDRRDRVGEAEEVERRVGREL